MDATFDAPWTEVNCSGVLRAGGVDLYVMVDSLDLTARADARFA